MNLKPPLDRITIESGKDYPDLQEEDLQQVLAFAAVDGTIDLHILGPAARECAGYR